jgi:peptidoglycan/LPS O-acetylase OafA/YrhL
VGVVGEGQDSVERPAHHRLLPHIEALDGFRGAAVAAVLLYHAHFHWARGGYLGVTAFFALSGFLITALLLRERERTGTISLGNFWVRRARRLVPGVLVLFALVVVLTWLGVLGTGSGRSTFADGAATATWLSNWRFVFSARSYGALFSSPSPFLHTWSLAIEEQFYLVFPVVTMILLGRRAGGRSRRGRLAVGLLGGVVLSTVLCAMLHPAGGAALRSYYGTDTRMAEPLAGALLALLLIGPSGLRVLGRSFRVAIDIAGIGAAAGLAYLVATLGESDDRLYRGGFLLAACLAAIMVAAATQPGTVMRRVLSVRPLAWLGRISYGTYLIHWPVFLWLTPARTGLSTWPTFALQVAVTLGLATLSLRLVEMPVREGRLRPRVAVAGWANASVGLLAALAVAGSVAPVAASAFTVVTVAPPPPPPPPAATSTTLAPAPQPATTGASPATTDPTTTAPQAATPSTRLAAQPRTNPTTAPSASTANNPGAAIIDTPVAPATPPPTTSSPGGGGSATPPTSTVPSPTPTTTPSSTSTTTPGPRPVRIAVVGDSMADGLGKALTTWAKGRSDVTVYDLGIPACPISRGGTRQFPDGYQFDVPPDCGWWGDPQSTRSQYLSTFAPDVVFVQDGISEVPDRKLPSWSDYRHPGQPLFDSWLLSEYRAAIQTFGTNKTTVVFANAVCVDWQRLAHWNTIQSPDQRVTSINGTYNVLKADGLPLLDLAGRICPGGNFSDTVEGVYNARPDGYHLSDQAALAVVTDWLGPTLIGEKNPARP